MNARDEVERQLIAAAAQKRLPEACQTLLDSRRELSDDAARFVERVRDACVAIGEASVRTQNALLPALRAEGVDVRVPSGCDNGRPRQFAYLELEADRRGGEVALMPVMVGET